MRLILSWPSGEVLSNAALTYPTFIRSDSVDISGEIASVDGVSLEGLAVVARVMQLNQDGTKTPAWTATGVLTEVVENRVYRVSIPLLAKDSTAGYDDGDAFVFDVEATSTLERKTVKSGFSIEEDYTENVV